MITRDDLPPTPDWLPESRDGNVRPWLQVDINEAPGMWDQDWAHWCGDDS